MKKQQLTESVIIGRVNRLTTNFNASIKSGGMSNVAWEAYFYRMMEYGKQLKNLNTKWKPRAKRFPFEFREFLK